MICPQSAVGCKAAAARLHESAALRRTSAYYMLVPSGTRGVLHPTRLHLSGATFPRLSCPPTIKMMDRSGGRAPPLRLKRRLAVGPLPAARPTHATPASYHGFVSLADCRPRKPRGGLRRRRLRKPDSGFATSPGVHDSLRKKNAKNDMSAIGSRLQGCCRTSP